MDVLGGLDWRMMVVYSQLPECQKLIPAKISAADLRAISRTELAAMPPTKNVGCFRHPLLLKIIYLQQIKWLILYLPHFRTAKAISSSNILKIIGLC